MTCIAYDIMYTACEIVCTVRKDAAAAIVYKQHIWLPFSGSLPNVFGNVMYAHWYTGNMDLCGGMCVCFCVALTHN